MKFYRSLYGHERSFTEAFSDAVKNRAGYIPEIRRIIEFYEGTKRGVTFWGR